MGTEQIKKQALRLSSTVNAVLTAIGMNGVQSYSELRSTHLSKYSRQHCWYFMKRLSAAGFVQEIQTESGSIAGWILTNKARNHLAKVYPEKSTQILKSPHYASSFRHDSILRQVHRVLEKSPVVVKWTPEWILKSNLLRNFKSLHAEDRRKHLLSIPDSILEIKSPHFTGKVSIELELTRKSLGRLYQRFESQVIADNYSFVLFIVEGNALKTKLQEIYKKVLFNSTRIKMSSRRNGIYFCELNTFLKEELRAAFDGLNSAFTFEALQT